MIGRYFPRVSSDNSARDEWHVHCIFKMHVIFMKKKLPYPAKEAMTGASAVLALLVLPFAITAAALGLCHLYSDDLTQTLRR